MFTVGVIGCGAWTHRVFSHLQADFRAGSGAEQIHPIFLDSGKTDPPDLPRITRARRYADTFEGESVTTSLEDFLERSDLEAVYIATPHHLHFPQALLAIDKGLPTLIEKPVALTTREAIILEEFSEAFDVKASVAENFRYLKSVQMYKNGELSLPEDPNISLVESWPMTQDSWRAEPAINGGGLLIDGGIHKISVARYLLGPVLYTKAVRTLASDHSEYLESCMALQLTHERGTSFIVHSGYGDQGSYQGTRMRIEDTTHLWPEEDEGVPLFWDNFIRYVRGTGPNPMPLGEATADLKVVEDAYRIAGYTR